jgi:hypothetical protein
VHGKVDAPASQCLFNFFREHAFRANFGQGNIGDLVSRSLDDFDFYRVAARFEQVANVVCLPQGKLGASGTDAEMSWNSDWNVSSSMVSSSY